MSALPASGTPAFAGATTACGGFSVDGLALALPIEAVGEVVPAPEFEPLPCTAPALIGACRLRGMLIPVIDLRVLFGRPAAPAGLRPRVLVLRDGARLLGLCVDAVSGVFMPAAGSARSLRVATPADADPATARTGTATATANTTHTTHTTGPAWLAGTVGRAEDEGLVSVLCAEALLALPGVPSVLEPEDPAHAPDANPDASRSAGTATLAGEPMMLLHCGDARLGLAAMAVHAAVPVTALRASPLQGELCRGVMAHAGRDVPAIDLLALLGLGRADVEHCERACLLRVGDGLVALLATDVIDVVPVDAPTIVPIPRFVLERPDLVRGALAPEHLPAAVVARMGEKAGQFLVLDPAALAAEPLLTGLASVVAPVEGGPARGLAATGAGPTRGAAPADRATKGTTPARTSSRADGPAVMVYALQGDVATPVSQIAEVLPYAPCGSAYAQRRGMLGMMVHRSRSIPVLCLCQLTGASAPTDTRDACVLVVEQDGDWLGFAVPRLRSIEAARWQPNPAAPSAAAGPATRRPAGRTPPMVLVGDGAEERLVALIDLQQLARQLRGVPEPASAADAASCALHSTSNQPADTGAATSLPLLHA